MTEGNSKRSVGKIASLLACSGMNHKYFQLYFIYVSSIINQSRHTFSTSLDSQMKKIRYYIHWSRDIRSGMTYINAKSNRIRHKVEVSPSPCVNLRYNHSSSKSPPFISLLTPSLCHYTLSVRVTSYGKGASRGDIQRNVCQFRKGTHWKMCFSR